jgi:dTDP-4-dehydrorhamnose reductase
MDGPTILVLGSSGLLGPYLSEEASKHGHLITSSKSSGNLVADLSCPQEVERLIEMSKPDWIIHAAGYTDVDGCEKDPNRAFLENTCSVAHVVSNMHADSSLVYFSTDQVYPSRTGPHEEDQAAPINTYGRTKFDGEEEALKHSRSLVLRTSFFGHSRTAGRFSLDDFMVSNFRKRKPFLLFSDVFFSPLHMKTLSEFVFLALSKGLVGVFNLGSRMGLSKAEFGVLVAEHSNLDHSAAEFGLSSAVKGRANRPLDLRLNSNKIETALGIQLPALSKEIRRL